MKKLIILFFILLAPVIALASGDAEGPSVSEFGYRVLTFSIFAYILVKLLKNPIKNLLTDRTVEIEKLIDDAVIAKESAEKELAAYKLKMADMEKELEVLKDRSMKAAEAEKKDIIADASKTVEKLTRFAESMINSEVQNAKDDLRKETLRLSIQLAEEKLSTSLDDAKQNELLKEYIKKIGVSN